MKQTGSIFTQEELWEVFEQILENNKDVLIRLKNWPYDE